jgi:prepilin-type processing-associated H-X9-DG protein
MTAGHSLEGDIAVPKGEGTGGGEKLYRLRSGLAQTVAADITIPSNANVSVSSIPVLIERPSGRWFKASGGNVLFMDGHVEFLRYPGPWPMTEKTIHALEQIRALQQEEN